MTGPKPTPVCPFHSALNEPLEGCPQCSAAEIHALRAENAALIEEEVMSLFAAMIRTAVNVVTVPLAVVADAVTLCDGDNPDGGFTSRAIERLKRRGGAMTTPKPTPRDSIYRLLAATADSPAVETLQADCSEIIVALDELDTLRAERDDLKVKLEEAGELLNLKTMALEEEEEIGSEAESRATALAARVEALRQLAVGQGPQHLYQGDCPYADDFEARDPDCPACQILSSAADLAAHDDRIRRETVERIDTYFHEYPIAWQDSSIPERSRYFLRAAGIEETK